MGALSNVDRDGFASAAFHSFPSTLQWDAYSGDYGPNFFGHAFDTGTYLVETKAFGWQAFGGTTSREGGAVRVRPTDSFRARVFLAPVGLFLTLDAGAFESVTYDPRTKRVGIVLAPATATTPRARLRVETTASGMPRYAPAGGYALDAGAFAVPLSAKGAAVTLSPVKG